MEAVVLLIHLFLAVAIIGLVLLQRSEGGGLGIGGGGGGLGNLASAQSMGNVLTRATAFCAMAFFCTSLALGVMARSNTQNRESIFDVLEASPSNAEALTNDMKDAVKTEEEEGAPAAPIAE